MKRMRFVMIGAGAIAQTYARVFECSKRGKLIGVADTRSASAEAIAEMMGCSGHTRYEEMIDRLKPDAAVVCTPPASHADICCDLLQRGIHVLCEKPLATDSEQARQMIATAQENGVTLAMASKFRFVDDVVRAKSLIASGTIGDVLLMENTFTARIDMSNRWNADPEVSGGGVIIDNGTHSVDIARYLLGPLVEVQAIEGRRTQSAAIEDTAWVFVRNANGAQGAIHLSWSFVKEQPHYISVAGSAGTLQVGWRGSKYQRWSDDDWTPFGSGYDKHDAFRLQLDNFVESTRGHAHLLIHLDDALASVQVIEAAYLSLSAGGWQHVLPGNGDLHLRAGSSLGVGAKDATS